MNFQMEHKIVSTRDNHASKKKKAKKAQKESPTKDQIPRNESQERKKNSPARSSTSMILFSRNMEEKEEKNIKQILQ